MGVNYFVFNGESSLDHGAYIGGQDTFNAPQRDVIKVKIPGKSGDLVYDNGRWLNVEVPYNLVIMDRFADHATEIRAWLNEPVGYRRLEDTYHPDFYRMARLANDIKFTTSAFNQTGKAQVIFDCQPQRWLKSGEQSVSIANGDAIYNPTRYDSKPIIRITCTGDGTLTIGDQEISVDDIGTYIDIDSDIQDCYTGSTSMNANVTLSDGFPILKPGDNTISWTGDITAVEITGRWYTI